MESYSTHRKESIGAFSVIYGAIFRGPPKFGVIKLTNMPFWGEPLAEFASQIFYKLPSTIASDSDVIRNPRKGFIFFVDFGCPRLYFKGKYTSIPRDRPGRADI